MYLTIAFIQGELRKFSFVIRFFLNPDIKATDTALYFLQLTLLSIHTFAITQRGRFLQRLRCPAANDIFILFRWSIFQFRRSLATVVGGGWCWLVYYSAGCVVMCCDVLQTVAHVVLRLRGVRRRAAGRVHGPRRRALLRARLPAPLRSALRLLRTIHLRKGTYVLTLRER